MTKANPNVENLQEIVDKAFPPHTGVITIEAINSILGTAEEQTYKNAMEFASQFDSLEASKEDWSRLDWALSVPGVAEQFPELAMELQMYYTLQISHKDFIEVVANIILATSKIVRDVVNSEDTLDCFKSTFQHYLPKDLAKEVECLLTQEAINQCDRELLPVDNSKRLQ